MNTQKKIKTLQFKGNDEPSQVKTTFAVDESGDPVFFDKKGRLVLGKDGVSPVLIMGCIYTSNPKKVRKKIQQAKDKILSDPLIRPFIRCDRLDKFFFHAKDDRAEIKKIFFETIKDCDIKARVIVARKDADFFKKRHNNKENVFYDDMITRLFTNVLYRSHENIIYFSKRGKRQRQEPLQDAIQTSINIFEQKSNFKIDKHPEIFVQVPTDEPLLEIVDYINWAVYRAFTSQKPGSDAYLNFILDKVKLIADIYDFEKETWEERYYNNKTNKFDAKKISPVGLGSGISSVPHRDGGRSPSKD